jgi:hypothetical protein
MKYMIPHITRLDSVSEACGSKSKRAPCATVRQRASTPKGPISANAKKENKKVPLLPKQLKKL